VINLFKRIELELKNSSNFVFVMPHPLNFKLLKKFSKSRFNYVTTSIIHDDKAHKGEFWPTKRSIKKIINVSTRNIFLSNFVFSKFKEQANFRLSELEALPLLSLSSKKTDRNSMVVAGRIRKYKNIAGVFEFANEIGPRFQIKIVGSGKFPTKKLPPNVSIENKWLDAIEFDRTIANASALLNLYTEATQSGPIAIAKAYKIPIIYNGVGGTKEQLESYPKKILLKDGKLNINRFENILAESEISENELASWPQMRITQMLVSNLDGSDI
jgi:glycosyltransferase involved in cell wall biosynthesis